jgi:hypothetical protein
VVVKAEEARGYRRPDGTRDENILSGEGSDACVTVITRCAGLVN